MNKKTKYQTYYCKHCGAEESIPEGLDNLKLNEITKVICPVCLCKGHIYQMFKVKQ